MLISLTGSLTDSIIKKFDTRAFFRRLFLLLFSFLLAFPGQVLAILPNDPNAEQWAYEDIKVYDAWDYTVGSEDVVVAILDNGFDQYHPDIADNVWKNQDEIPLNGIDDDHNGYIDDVWGWDFEIKDRNGNGGIEPEEEFGDNTPRPDVFEFSKDEDSGRIVHHGTYVAGLVGAVGNNRKFGVGINWKVRLMNVKVLGNAGSGNLTNLGRAIQYAVDNGADIINISMVGGISDNIVESVKYAYDNGVLIVAAAGNDFLSLNDSPQYPICADEGQKEQWILGVSAITRAHRSAPFSNVGSDCVDITAPGIDIKSALRYAPDKGLEDYYQEEDGWNGTSFSAPLVSGAAALVKSLQPDWGPKEIFHALTSTVHKTPPENEEIYTDLFGAGLLQINNAAAFAAKGSKVSVAASVLSGKAFITLDRDSGYLSVQNVGERQRPPYIQNILKNVDSAAVYEKSGRKYFVTVSKLDNTKRIVRVYSDLWQVEHEWSVPAKGHMDLAVADIREGDDMEIILAPEYADKFVLGVYSLDGIELGRVDNDNEHVGVRLGLFPLIGFDKYELLAGYKDGSNLVLHHYDQELNLVNSISMPFFKFNAVPRAGDVDGDGELEYVVAAGENEVPLVAYAEQGGEFNKLFYVEDLSYTSGLNMTVVDYDQDGIDDILVGRMKGDDLVRVWNYEARKIGQWDPFPEVNGSSLEILSVF